MPLKQDFGSFRQPVHVIDPLQQALTNVQQSFMNMENMDLKHAEEQRAKDIFAADQKDKADRRFTQNAIGQILAAPYEKRADLLDKLTKGQSGWTPNAQEHAILQEALAPRKVDQPTGSITVTMPDGKVTSAPAWMLPQLQKAGATIGEYKTKGKGSGSGAGKQGGKGGQEYPLTSEATKLGPDIGEKDAEFARSIGGKLQEFYDMPTNDTANLIQQSINRGELMPEWLTDKKLDMGKLAANLDAAGYVPNSSIATGKDANGNTLYRRMTSEDMVKVFTNDNLKLRTVPDPSKPGSTMRVLVDMSKVKDEKNADQINNAIVTATELDKKVEKAVENGEVVPIDPKTKQQAYEKSQRDAANKAMINMPEPTSYWDKVKQGAEIRLAQAVANPLETAEDIGRGALASIPGLFAAGGDLVGVETPVMDTLRTNILSGLNDKNSIGAEVGEILAPVGAANRVVKPIAKVSKARSLPSVGTIAGKTYKTTKDAVKAVSNKLDSLSKSPAIKKSASQRKRISELREQIRTGETDLTTAELAKIQRKIEAIEASMNKNILKGN